MKQLAFLAAFLVLTALAAPVVAQENFTGDMDESQQVPPSGATATATATLQLNSTGEKLTYTITFTGVDLDGAQTADPADDMTAFHIHVGDAGVNGPVAFGMVSPGDDADDLVIDAAAGTVSGMWEVTDVLTNGGTLADFLDELRADGLYFNIHTVGFTPGAIRGQILSVPPLSIPTLGEIGIGALALLLMLAGFVVLRRKAS